MGSHKRCLCMELRVKLLCCSEYGFDDPLKIEQKIPKAQPLQAQYESSPVPFGEGSQVEPYPDVSKDHRQPKEEQTQKRIPGTRTNARFVHLRYVVSIANRVRYVSRTQRVLPGRNPQKA